MNENSSGIHEAFISHGYKRGMFSCSHAHRAMAALLLATATSAAAASTAERPLAIDFTHSHVEVAVKATVDSFTGRLTRYGPAVVIDDAGRVSAARLSFHFRDVETGKPGRDEAMHKWQKSDSFPDGEFVLSSLEPAASGGFTAFGRLPFTASRAKSGFRSPSPATGRCMR